METIEKEPEFDKGYDMGFNRGFDEGFNRGFIQGYEQAIDITELNQDKSLIGKDQ